MCTCFTYTCTLAHVWSSTAACTVVSIAQPREPETRISNIVTFRTEPGDMRHTTADRDKVGDRHSAPDACLRPRSTDDPGDPRRRTLVNPLATVESLLSSSLAPTFYIIISPVLLASAIVLFGGQCRVCFSVIYRSVTVCLPGVCQARAAPAYIRVHHIATVLYSTLL